MLNIQKKTNLAQYSTLKIGGSADYFAVVKDKTELLEALNFAKTKKLAIFILGGGSNTFFGARFKGLVIKDEIKGIEVIKKSKTKVLLKVLGGEIWTRFITYCLGNNYYGLENLYGIYGTAGAAPIQNIGAYGVEVADCLKELEAIDLKTGKSKIFSKADCKFGYRDSIFKNKLKNRYFVYSLTLKLNLKPKFNLSNLDLKRELANIKKSELKASDITKAILKIRDSKLPSPGILPNVGSFFKNPLVKESQFKKLIKIYPNLKYFKEGSIYRLPAGWLIDQCGFKGKNFGKVGVYEKQALVLINRGGATAKDLEKLEKMIKNEVKGKFGVELEREVNFA